MKVTFEEHGSSFGLNLVPETAAETIRLMRFGVNVTSQLKSVDVYAPENTEKTRATIVFGKRKRLVNHVGKRNIKN